MEQPGEALRLTVRDCFECFKPSGDGRTCNFVRGLAAGAFGALFRQDLSSEEVKCRLKGAGECVFILKAKDGQPLT
jgi:predicted hydrocarbon binding protein